MFSTKLIAPFKGLISPTLIRSASLPLVSKLARSANLRSMSTASWIELDRSAVTHNVNTMRESLSPHCKLAAVLKGNAYGHGLIPMFTMVQALVDCIVVFNPQEALAIRTAESHTKHAPKRLLILGPVTKDDIIACAAANIEMVLDASWAEHLAQLHAMKLNVRTHIHLDTGMTREGFDALHIENELAFLKKFKSWRKVIKVCGVMSHLGDADNSGGTLLADKQLAIFNHSVTRLQQFLGLKSIERHVDASGGSFLHPEANFDMVRCGITLYGHWPSNKAYMMQYAAYNKRHAWAIDDLVERGSFYQKFPTDVNPNMPQIIELARSFNPPSLKPVLTWKCRSQVVKYVAEKRYVGYGCNAQCDKDSIVAVFPVGYSDGCPDPACFHIMIQGQKAPVLAVMMNHLVADVTHLNLSRDLLHKTQLEAELCVVDESKTNGIYHPITRIGAHLERRICKGNLPIAENKPSQLPRMRARNPFAFSRPQLSIFETKTSEEVETKMAETQKLLPTIPDLEITWEKMTMLFHSGISNMSRTEYLMLRELFDEERARRKTNPTQWDQLKNQLAEKLNTLFPFDEKRNMTIAARSVDNYIACRSKSDISKNEEEFLTVINNAIKHALIENKQTDSLQLVMQQLSDLMKQKILEIMSSDAVEKHSTPRPK